MIATRWLMLLVAALLVLAASGVALGGMQPAALRVGVTAVVGVLAPLFWPGLASTSGRTALRVLAWSFAAAAAAAVLLVALGQRTQTWTEIAASCAMLALILVVAHGAAAALEALWRAGAQDAQDAHTAREGAGRSVTAALLLLGALPLWLGPLADALSRRHAWLVDAVVSLSPLSHLAVASGNDLLRNDWFYQHSSLAGLQFAYPGPGELAGFYATAGALLALTSLAIRRAGLPTSTEKTR